MSNSKHNSKTIALACAVLLTCASAQLFASTSFVDNASVVYAETVSVNKTVSCKDEANHTIKGLKPFDLVGATGTLKTISCTFKTSTGEIPTAFTGAFGVAVAQNCPYATDEYWYQGDSVDFTSSTIKDNGNGTFTVNFTVPTNIQSYINYSEEWGNLEIGCYYCDIDEVTLISVSDSASSSPTITTPSTTTKQPSTTTKPSSGNDIVDKTELEKNNDGTDTLKIYLKPTSSGTVDLVLTGGVADATTSGLVGYWDSTAGEWVEGSPWEEKKFDSSGKLTISGLKVPANTEEVQILLTYYADWSSGSEKVLDKTSLNVSVISATGSTTTEPNNPVTPPDLPSNAQCGWTDITEGTDNTQTKNLVSESVSGDKKTITITQGGQWSSYDGEDPIILDQTYEPEKDANGNDIYDTDVDNENITNSNNFMFTDSFGIPKGAELNHFRFTVESDEPMYQVQLGAGISVQKNSDIANSGSYDEAGNLSPLWFNESGTAPTADDPENDYSTIENKNGKKYYGLSTVYEGGTNYIKAQWNVYDDVKEFVTIDEWSSVAVQYWYGVDPADWKVEGTTSDTIQLKPQTINITEATASYNITETYDYTDTATQNVGTEIAVGGEMSGIKFSDLDLGENDVPKAVTFKVSGASDIGKLVGSFGVSVSDDYTGDDLESTNWYQSDNIVYEDCGDSYEITWIIPANISKFVEPEYDAEVKFGCWYAGAGENALSSLTIDSVSVDYYSEPVVTTVTTVTTPVATTTTEATTTTNTTTTSVNTTTSSETTTTQGNEDNIVWGDATCDGNVMGNDLLLLKKYVLGLDTVTEQGLKNSDVTHDGDVMGNDLLKLKKFMLGLIEQDELAHA